MRARLADVAAAAGVSLKTVSNVLNDYPHIRPETKERVLQAIGQLEYRPNLSARNLARGRTGTIALAVPAVDLPYFAELVSRVMRAAQRRSWTVIVEQTDGDPGQEERILRGEFAHHVDGIIMSPLSVGTEALKAAATHLPLILLGEHPGRGAADHVGIDNVAAARAATGHLISLGRKRIALIGSAGLDAPRRDLRLRGYAEALQSAGLPMDRELIRPVAGNRGEPGLAAMTELLRLDRRPDAVFCVADLLALGALRAMHGLGLSAPEDIAVVGFDDTPYGRISAPSLTTVATDKEHIADTAIAMLEERVGGTAPQRPRRRSAQFRLIVRESTVPDPPEHRT